VDGEPVCDRTLAAVRRRVGLVFQDPDDQLFMPTVLDDVAFGPRNLQLPQAEVEQRVREALEAVDLWAQRAKAPFRLSGGERKRAAIAGVLAMAPDVMVLDEPTSGLDPHARHQVMTLVAGFPHTRIVASHDLELVRALCPRTLVLHEGALVADGATARILEDRALLTRCRLGHPPGMAVCRTGGPGAVGGTASTP
jgi:cobalt/nickel transport system ATP-binding protein